MRFARKRARPEQIVAAVVGISLLVSGLFHAFVWLLDGSSLAGSVSWRKPILFGISAGVTVLSVGWLVGKMRPRSGDLLLVAGFSVAMLLEVALITMQQWRGVPSHFNRSTSFDSTVLNLIELLIFVATIVIAELTRRSFGKLNVADDMKLAIRSGMSLLLLSCLLGFVLVAYGNYQNSVGRPPEIYGQAGVMKFPHGVPMHAIQFLPILSWLLVKVGVEHQKRLRGISYALAGMLSFTCFSLVQTFSGRARFDLTWFSSFLLAATIVLAILAIKDIALRASSRLTAPFEASSRDLR